jgi:hypothetical protein
VAELFNSKPESSGLIVSPLGRNEIHMFEPVILSTEETRKTIIFQPPYIAPNVAFRLPFFDPFKSYYKKKTVADCMSSPVNVAKHITNCGIV